MAAVERAAAGAEETSACRGSGIHAVDERMVLTKLEHKWAVDIKKAIQDHPDLEPMSDFWYAQLAIVCQNDIHRAVECAGGLQNFKQEYHVDENVDFGVRILRDFQRFLPEFWLSLAYNDRDGNYALICDNARFYQSVLTAHHSRIQTWLIATFFINHALCPDFYAIRKGAIFLCENEGFDMKRNSGMKLYKKLWYDLCLFYPFRFDKCKNFGTGVFTNIITSMAKPFLPADIYSKFEMGCQCDGRLSDIYLTPTVQAANARLLDSTRESLRKRYANEALFSLSDHHDQPPV